MHSLPKLKPGDKVAILSPSSAAPGIWPHVYQLGLKRLKEEFGLIPVEYPTTTKVGASTEERSQDLIAAFEDEEIKGVITSIGGDDQVTYISDLPSEPFVSNPKPFFGFSDNSHFENFLWLNGIPSYYGGALFTQFAMQGEMDAYTKKYLNIALFEGGEHELVPSEDCNDVGYDWGDKSTLETRRVYEPNEGWHWDGTKNTSGILWGGCLESIDAMLRHEVSVPSSQQFSEAILILETSEEIPTSDYVGKVINELGERGTLSQIQGVLMGRPKAWEFDKPKQVYREEQRSAVLTAVRAYNSDIPVVQNLNFGHTDPQIPMPYGNKISISPVERKIMAEF